MKQFWPLLGVFFLTGCLADVTYLGSYKSGFRSVGESKVSPAQAYEKAKPHMAETLKRRCESRPDKTWCKKPARDHMVLQGNYYYITRESYPYKSLYAYLKNAVKVHKDSGELSFTYK